MHSQFAPIAKTLEQTPSSRESRKRPEAASTPQSPPQPRTRGIGPSLEAFAWKSSALFGKTRPKPGTSVAASGACLHDLSRARGLQLSRGGREGGVVPFCRPSNVFNGGPTGSMFRNWRPIAAGRLGDVHQLRVSACVVFPRRAHRKRENFAGKQRGRREERQCASTLFSWSRAWIIWFTNEQMFLLLINSNIFFLYFIQLYNLAFLFPGNIFDPSIGSCLLINWSICISSNYCFWLIQSRIIIKFKIIPKSEYQSNI